MKIPTTSIGYPFVGIADHYGVPYGAVARAALAVEKFADPAHETRNRQSLDEIIRLIPDASVRQSGFYDDVIAAKEAGMRLWGRL